MGRGIQAPRGSSPKQQSTSFPKQSNLGNMKVARTGESPHLWLHRRTLCYIQWYVLCMQTLLCNPLTEPFQWCSLCSDVRDILVLCVGCRVGICMSGRGMTGGCLTWCPDVEAKGDFIFECPYCAEDRNQPFKVSIACVPVALHSSRLLSSSTPTGVRQ